MKPMCMMVNYNILLVANSSHKTTYLFIVFNLNNFNYDRVSHMHINFYRSSPAL